MRTKIEIVVRYEILKDYNTYCFIVKKTTNISDITKYVLKMSKTQT